MTEFSTEEQQRIADAVTQAEKSTSGEIVPLILPQADDYQSCRCHTGALLALAVATMWLWLQPGTPYWGIALLLCATYIVTQLVLKLFPPLLHLLVAKDEMSYHVDVKAHSSFVRYGLHHTRDETGILILICLFERRIQILADRGINSKVDPKQWEEIVAIITSGLRTNKTPQACDALCQAITKCGELLTPLFPIKDDDTNELPNIIHK